jgi:flagellar motor switch protein FliG
LAKEVRVVSNIRRAAIVLMSLPQEEAASILSRLQPQLVEQVSIEIAKIGRFTSDEQEHAILSFAESNPHALGGSSGGLDVAKSLLERALGRSAQSTVDNVKQSVEALPFGFLKRVDPQHLVTFINDEHPQTIALILSHLPASYGAQIISGLSAERQLAVIRRIANMGQTSPEVIEEIQTGLETRMAAVVSQSYQNAGGLPAVAEILNVIGRQTERSIMELLSQDDPELVDQIRRLMFVFEDISKLSDKSIQAILKNVETSQWALALKGCSEELKQKILGNMSQRAAAMLQEEMEYLGPVRLAEVESVQQQIVDVVRKLEDTGEISVNSGTSEEQYIQ